MTSSKPTASSVPSESYASNGSSHHVPVVSIAPLRPGYPQGPVAIPNLMYGMGQYEPPDRLDLDDADFAPAPPRSTQSIAEELQACREKPGLENGHTDMQGSERSSLDTSESSGVSETIISDTAIHNFENSNKVHYTDSPPELVKSSAVVYTDSPPEIVKSSAVVYTDSPPELVKSSAVVYTDSPPELVKSSAVVYTDSPPELLKSSAVVQKDQSEETSYRTISEQHYDRMESPSASMGSHPDVIPTSITPMMDVARAGCHETQSDSGVSFTTSEQSDTHSLQVHQETLENSAQNVSPVHQMSPPYTASESSRQSLSPEPIIGLIPEEEETVHKPHRNEIDNSANINAISSDNSQVSHQISHADDAGSLPNTDVCKDNQIFIPNPADANIVAEGQASAPSDLSSSHQVASHEGPSNATDQNTWLQETTHQQEKQAVGFDFDEDEEIDVIDMETYLADMDTSQKGEILSDVIAASSVPQQPTTLNLSDVAKCEDVDMETDLLSYEPSSLHSQESVPARSNNDDIDRRESTESVEKFLIPDLMSPCITTPREDLGFTKVPGFVPMEKMTILKVDNILNEDLAEEDSTPNVPQKESGMAVEIAEEVEESKHKLNQQETEPAAFEAQEVGTHSSHVDKIADGIVRQNVTKPNFVGMGRPGISSLNLRIGTAVAKEAVVLPSTTQNAAFSEPQPELIGEQQMENGISAALSKSPTGIGARPKEPSQMRKNRPSSLFGLSKPDIKAMTPVPYDENDCTVDNMEHDRIGMPMKGLSDNGELPESDTALENSHDIINRQLAQKNKSPLRKKQLNLEIKQQIDNGSLRTDVLENKADDESYIPAHVTSPQGPTMFELTSPSQGYAPAARPVLSNTEGCTPVTRPVLSDTVYDMSQQGMLLYDNSSNSQSFQILDPQSQPPPPNQMVPVGMCESTGLPSPAGLPGPAADMPSSQLETGMPAQIVGAQPEVATPPKQKRPTSLNIMPRGDFHTDAKPMEDVDLSLASCANSSEPQLVADMSVAPDESSGGWCPANIISTCTNH